MRRFAVPSLPEDAGLFPLPPDTAHYATRVLRLQDGARVELFDGQGRTATGELRGAAVMIEALQVHAALASSLAIALPPLKGERMDWAIEKMGELGASVWWPLHTEFTQQHELKAAKLERYERIAQAAARQSGGVHTLRIEKMTALTALPLAHAVVLDPRAEVALATVVAPEMVLVIGPEGGFSPAEHSFFASQGVTRARLVPTILRAETAAIAALSVAAARLTELMSPPRE